MAGQLLVTGTIGFDTITNRRGKAERVVGGSGSYSSIAASYFCGVKLIGIIGEDFRPHLKNFKKNKIDLRGVETAQGKSFFWAANYDKDFKNAFTQRTDLNVFGGYKPKIIKEYQNCKNIFLDNIEPSMQLSLISQLKNPNLIVCDTMNLWINNYFNLVKKVIKKADILLVNEAEARSITGQYNLITAGKKLLKMGAGHIIIKLGPNGSMLVSPLGICQMPPVLVENIYDTTGAGDAFGGALAGYLANQKNWRTLKNLKTAMAYGTVMASFNIESFSVSRINSLTKRQLAARLAQYRKSVCF
ncbi:MAG: PfkB family carbohydrate kinase [Elusimicrobium sp.]|nr:PfkB family carbohydrate kinase [Elusimicrobium sp.]